ncbi:TIGR03752 family integrating conjugative element protein, partial [Escherichia coli]
MQIKSNTLVKFVVPGVVLAGVFIGLKSCGDSAPSSDPSAQQTQVLGTLSQEELKALGVEGDTPEDTLRTLIGRLNQVRERQQTLDEQNSRLLKENEQLRKRGTDVSGQLNDAVAGLQKSYEEKQHQLQNEQNTLMAKVQSLTEQLSQQGHSGKADANSSTDSDIPLGLGLDGLSGSPGSTVSQGADGLMWVTPADQSQPDPRDVAGGKSGPRFPTSFLEDNPLTRQKAAYEQQVKGYSNEKQQATTQAVYTLPENATLVGSRAMT